MLCRPESAEWAAFRKDRKLHSVPWSESRCGMWGCIACKFVVQGLTEGALTEVNVNPTNREFIKLNMIKRYQKNGHRDAFHNGKMKHGHFTRLSPETSLLNHWVWPGSRSLALNWLWSSRDRTQLTLKMSQQCFFLDGLTSPCFATHFCGIYQNLRTMVGSNPGILLFTTD